MSTYGKIVIKDCNDPNFTVRLTFVSHVNGAQCVEVLVPSCRLVQNQIQHVSGITVLIPETLHLPVMFLFTGITQRGVYDSVSREIGADELVALKVPWLSQNLQLLGKFKKEPKVSERINYCMQYF